MKIPQSLATFTASLLLSFSLTSAISPADVPSDLPVSKILSLASAAFSSGSTADALAYYDIAIQRDPSNYLTIFKRGATCLSLGRSSQALSDFDRVLTLKPGFEGALLQRAKIRQRTADWNGAREDYLATGKSEAELSSLNEAEGAATLAKDAEKAREWEACVAQASIAIMTATASLELRQLRARCRLEKGEILEAVTDMQHIVQLAPSITDLTLQISAMLFYAQGESEKGLDAVRKCVQSDPEHKSCGKLLKRERKIEKQLKKMKQSIEKRNFNSAVKLLIPNGENAGLLQEVQDDIKEWREQGYIHSKASDQLYVNLLETTCDAYLEMDNTKRGTPHCKKLLDLSPNSLPGLIHLAKTQIDEDDFEGAMRTLSQAKENHPGASGRINPLQQQAQTLLRRSKQKDYYKVLDLTRDASSKDIKRAYLKLSKQNHPDKAPSAAERPQYEKRMAAINEAYEVLSDPELKARFDAGDDPNDPEAQARGHGGPFHGSPFPFEAFTGQGGGRQFVFKSGPGQGGGGPGGMPFFENMFGGGGGGGFQFGF